MRGESSQRLPLLQGIEERAGVFQKLVLARREARLKVQIGRQRLFRRDGLGENLRADEGLAGGKLAGQGDDEASAPGGRGT